MPVARLRLAREDEIRFRDEAVEVFHDERALHRMLGDIGLPRRHWPQGNQPPTDAWQHALDALGNGAHAQGQAALLDQARRAFPRNPVFVELHHRYLAESHSEIHGPIHDGEQGGRGTAPPGNALSGDVSETARRARPARTGSGPVERGSSVEAAPDLEAARDFFVSYTGQDTAWAEWIAWVLEEEGYRVLVQAWDFVGGVDWVNMMQDGLVHAERMIVVLSHAYLESTYCAVEWQAMRQRDPLGAERQLLIARVEDSPHPGMLNLVRCDLFGKDEAEATRVLLRYVAGAEHGRLKPVARPPFPAKRIPSTHPRFPGGMRQPEQPSDG